MDIVTGLMEYTPYNEQEAHDREVMLHLLQDAPDIFDRTNQTAHFTASSWLLNQSHDKVLMIYHNIYHSWSWTGGHADGDRDLLAVAKKEAMEETGVTEIRTVSDGIFSIEILTVDGHIKKGSYVPSHLHLNVTYLLEADSEEQVFVKEDENSGVGWFSVDEVPERVSEAWMNQRIYSKLMAKVRRDYPGNKE